MVTKAETKVEAQKFECMKCGNIFTSADDDCYTHDKRKGIKVCCPVCGCTQVEEI